MVKPVFDRGPITYLATTIANGGNIKGGQLVEPDGTTGKIKVCTALSVACLGVATGNTSASDYSNADTTDTWGQTVVNAQYPPNEVSVGYQGIWKLKVAAATTTVPFGALVKAAAAGEVQLHSQGAAATYDMIVGRCVEPAGIAAGATGKILLAGIGA
jgi:hypothetical protein